MSASIARALGVLGVVAIVASARPARADDDGIVVRRMKFAERRGELRVTTGFRELFDARAIGKLSSGFPTTVVVRLYVYRKDRELPSSLAVATYQVVYDLWEEVYTVRAEGPLGQRTRRFARRADVLREITALDAFPIAPLDRVPIGPHHFLAMVIELDPVSEELLAETRRWLTRPAAESRLDTSSSFFGSFVSVFVNPKLEAAARVLRIRSQPFYRVAR